MGQKPYFEDEIKIVKKIGKLRKEIKKKENELNKFVEAKSLLTSREYNLEKKIPKFFSSHFGLNIEKEEKFIEDFWILDNNDKRAIICEVKSINKGFKKTFVFKLYNHRDSYNLDEEFPGLLVVNHHLQAGSWEDKNRPIDPQDYRTASEYNILILRVEDIVNLWDGLRKEEIEVNVLDLFKNNSGWLKISDNYEFEFHNK